MMSLISGRSPLCLIIGWEDQLIFAGAIHNAIPAHHEIDFGEITLGLHTGRLIFARCSCTNCVFCMKRMSFRDLLLLDALPRNQALFDYLEDLGHVVVEVEVDSW